MEIRDERELAELQDAIVAREQFEDNMKNIKNIWNYSPKALEAKKAAMSMLSTKTGLYAKVPINCKGHSCPYATTCVLLEAGLDTPGEKCPLETALIEVRYAGYQDDYGLDASSYTDNTIISEIINLDVMMERAKSLLAAAQTPIEEVMIGVNEAGDALTRPEISKAWEIYERASNKREKLLDTMLGTRKSRKGIESNDSTVNDLLQEVYTQDFVIEERPDHLK